MTETSMELKLEEKKGT